VLLCSGAVSCIYSLRRREIPLVKQIERGTQGPIADAHLNVLLELEALYPNNAGTLLV
jgi:hypothetical protein